MNNLSILKITLRVFGIAFIFIMPMMKLDPLGGWAWSPGQWEYEMMIQGVYMTLGVMMLIAANDPLKNPLFQFDMSIKNYHNERILRREDSNQMSKTLPSTCEDGSLEVD